MNQETAAVGFIDIANSYLDFISNVIIYSSIQELIVLLMKLYISAYNLPEVEPETIEAVGGDCILHVEFTEGLPTLYRVFDDPFNDKRFVYGNLIDDLQDIAHSLIKGINEFNCGRVGNAVFEWKFGIIGQDDIINAVKALYALIN